LTKKLWFQVGVGILLALLIIRYFLDIKGILSPIIIVAKAIALPLLLGGVLYYITEPIQRFLVKRKFPRWASILTILVGLLAVIWIVVAFIGPLVTKQVNNLVENAPVILAELDVMKDNVLQYQENLPEKFQDSIDSAAESLLAIATGFLSWIVQFLQSFLQGLFMLILVPFFFIYMLKDHEKFAPFIYGFFSGKRKEWVQKTLQDIDHVLRSYIQGQLLVSVFVGVMLLIGYLIIKLDYALLLAIFGLFMNLIPFIGPWISVIPAIIIAFIQDPTLVIWVGVIMLAAQQIESNLITPNVMGKSLDIHPLTVITVILAAGNIAGFLGIILAIPTYAVGKAIVKNIYARRREIKETATKTV
jgi:predicted PurR-regulated permease PerM